MFWLVPRKYRVIALKISSFSYLTIMIRKLITTGINPGVMRVEGVAGGATQTLSQDQIEFMEILRGE